MNLPTFSIPLLDTLIGVALLIFELSIVHSGILELYQVYRNKRNKFLYESLQKAFNDPANGNLAERILNHPSVRFTKPKANHPPSYLSSSNFADAVTGILLENVIRGQAKFDKGTGQFEIEHPTHKKNVDVIKLLKTGIENLEGGDSRQLFSEWLIESATITEFKTKAGNWFTQYQDVVSSDYKRKLLLPSIILGCLMAVLFNANLFNAVKFYWNNERARDEAVAISYQIAAEKKAGTSKTGGDSTVTKEEMSKALDNLKNIKAPLGWTDAGLGFDPSKENFFQYLWELLKSVAGWLCMGMALAFGSDKWFALMTKLLELRGIIKPDTTAKKT